MDKAGLQWKLNRLRAMSLPEITWRVRKHVQAKTEGFGYGLSKSPQPENKSCGKSWLASISTNFDAEPYCSAADRILSGHFSLFALKDLYLGFPPNWNRDPLTGKQAPLEYGKSINYRDQSLAGNIKYLWEINRHLELVTLGQAYHLTGDDKYAKGVFILLDAWMRQCPYPYGLNWTSSLELALRLVNWSFTWYLIGGDEALIFDGQDGEDFKTRWLKSIHDHCYFISKHLSFHSSANNHLLGEYMGLFVGSVIWPLWAECSRWCEMAKQGLEREVKKQISSDGVNLEQAIWYQHEVVDMMLICGLIGKANGIRFSDDYWGRLEATLDFIVSISDYKNNIPMIGDSDDAVMVRFSTASGFNVYNSLLASGAVLFNRGDFKKKAPVFDDKCRWLLGDAGAHKFDQLNTDAATLPARSCFPEGGYYILGHNFETAEEIRMVVDNGPLGYLSIAAHGHADALSVCLSAGGREFLIDPGTYAYHTKPKWRNYFRSTSAHNTVRVDREDQSVIGGNFLWLAKAASKNEKWQVDEGEDFFCGTHDGYLRLEDPVLHRRSVKFVKVENKFVITDTMECKGEHFIELFWHFAEPCIVREGDNGLIVDNNESRLRLVPPHNMEVSVDRGDEKEPIGWISRKFDEKEQISTARYSIQINGTTEIVTRLTLETI